MTRFGTLALAALVAGGSAFALFAGESDFPDPALTPGVVASTDVHEVCGYVGNLSYSKRHRATTDEMKREVKRRYGITGYWRGEIDHLISLCLGGADDIKNLWPQKNYHEKDRLESHLCREVCAGRVDLKQAQQDIAHDWVSAYRKYLGSAPSDK